MKKRIFPVLLLILSVLSLICVNVSAAASEIIDGADITVNINTDGTATVSEKWTVSYITASDVFYRNFDVPGSSDSMTLLQNYEAIKDISVKIDGNSIIEAENGINTYSVSQTAETLEIAVSCPSASTVREYQIDYTLTGAVKKVSGEACFSAMILGDTFIYTSNNVNVRVIFPEGVKNVRTDNADAVTQGNRADFISKRVYDTLPVEVYADADIFESGALVKYSHAKDSVLRAGNFLKGIIPFVIAVIGAVLVVILVLLPDRILRIPYEKRAEKMLKNSDSSPVLPDGITPCTAYKMLCPVSRISPKTSSKKVSALFAMAILECIDSGYIIPEGNELIVGTPCETVPAYIASVLNFLKTFCDKKGNKFVIDASFAHRVENECNSRYDVIANYLATFYSLIPSVSLKNEKNKELYENAYCVKKAISEEKHKNDFARCLGMVISGTSVRDNAVFSMLFSPVSEKTFAPSGRTGEQSLCSVLLEMHKVFVKSK